MQRFIAALVIVSATSSAAVFANVSGAIFTTIVSGAAVNHNIYEAKTDVYLNGGPQNHNGSPLTDGLYYFQVTDPGGKKLLSTDPVECRVLVVNGGRVRGTQPAPGCAPHQLGDLNATNGSTPVQLMPFDDTPNPGGEYKAWVTPVAAYTSECVSTGRHSNDAFGFCASESKTDNFKVRASAPDAAQITVCKFNDINGNSAQDASEPFIAHWPITATGVDGGTIDSQTDDHGCTSFTVSTFESAEPVRSVTLTEGTFGPDWVQTAPVSCDANADCAIAGGAITLQVRRGELISAPSFGNANPYCQEGCTPGGVLATATAYPSLARTFEWTIAKAVEQARINSVATTATANYSVTVSHDAGTDSDWQIAGSVRVANSGHEVMTALTLSAAAPGAVCAFTNASNVEVGAGSHRDFDYACSFTSVPAAAVVEIAGAYAGGQLTATTPFDFASAVISAKDGEAIVVDSMAGELGVVDASSPSPSIFHYAAQVGGIAGTCTGTNNIATLTTNTSQRSQSASQGVRVCVGAALTASASMSTAFGSSIAKSADRTLVQQQGGNVTFNYTISVTESGWRADGLATIVNPNDWQDVATNVAVAIPAAACQVAGPMVTVPASATTAVNFSCTFAAAPPANLVAMVTVSWDGAAAYTAIASAQASAAAAFSPLTIVDAFNGGASTILGTIAVPAALTTFSDVRTVANASAGACRSFVNEASISGRQQSATQSVTACNTVTGARTIGFWQNKNGQAIVTGGASAAGVCSAATWLRQLTPFQDLGAASSCKALGTYVTNVIKNASAAGASMNAMLKAQMLASALNVYFSSPAGANALAAPVAVGSVRIDLAGRGDAFGGAASMTVIDMLLWQNGVSNAGGTSWYGNAKAVQELAKTAFDKINNEIAPIAQ